MLYYPIVTFHYGYPESSLTSSRVVFGYYDLSSEVNVTHLANVSAYDYYDVVESGEWAIQVASASWGYFPTDKEFTNDAAILASTFEFISIPESFYAEYENYLEKQGF